MKRLLRADMLTAVVLWVCLLPFQDQIALACGHPLRLMATVLSVGALQLLGMNVSNEATTIHVGPADIAITDACSGIEELLAMVLVGWLLARFRQRSFGWSLFAWAFSVPSVVIANTLRLMLLVVLYAWLGDTVLTGVWHTGLGYAQAIGALLLMWWFGELTKKVAESDEEKSGGKADER